MIRFVLGQAFQRWGLPGLLCTLLLMMGVGWWLVSGLWWLVTGAVFVLGGLAGLGYVLVVVFVVGWFRGRRTSEHPLSFGRRRWPD
jgi:hypothetical protein